MKSIIILSKIILFFTYGSVYSQQISLNDNFNYQIRTAQGDLNGDGLLDMAIITMDTINDTRPLSLQILFAQPNGKLKLFFSSITIIEAMYPIEKKGAHNGSQIPDIYIEEGNLQIDFYIKGNSSYDFKFNDGKFELIHFTYVNWDGINITTTVFNLLTGKYLKQTEAVIKTEKNIRVRPLPQLEHFKPFENELY